MATTWMWIKAQRAPLFALAGLLLGLFLLLALRMPVAGRWVWLLTLAIGGAPLVWNTLRGMLHGEFAADVVAMLAIVTSLVMNEPFAGVVIVLMQTGGEALERYSLGRASSALDALVARAPRFAYRRSDGEITRILADGVRVADLLVVRPGDLLPVDGVLTSESADVDESALTGEPVARRKKAGDALMSGTVNTGGAFEMRATREAADSQYARIVDLVREAQGDKAPLQRLADRYAVWFTPLTLVMCAVGWAITSDPRTILAVLVVATPCPLILAAPVAVVSGINRAAAAGIIVKGAAALERIGTATAFVFDKTGTLTHGAPALSNVMSFGDVSQGDLLHLAGSVEQLSSHALAQTVAAAARRRCGPLAVATRFSEIPGRGVSATLDGREILIGSERLLLERIGCSGPDVTETPGVLVAYVAAAGRPVGLLRFTDPLRPGVAEMMRRLRAGGVRHIALLTGDNALNAHSIATGLNIDEVRADLLPEDKVTAVRNLLARFAGVVMVGDGINDAPALATATVGVSMGARGAGISAQAADIVLLEDDVTKVADAVTISRRMLHIARQSIVVGLGLSAGCMVAAAFGKIPPVTGAILQEVIDVAVILNALRAR